MKSSAAPVGGVPLFRVASLDDQESVDLLADYEAELARQGIVLDREEAGGVGVEEMVAPHGLFLLVELDKVIIACGGVRRLSSDVAEIKRMYVAPAARRRGVASALLARLEHEARGLGCRVTRLDTGRRMVAALTLYRAAGYREIPDYNGNPHAAHWMEKVLQDIVSETEPFIRARGGRNDQANQVVQVVAAHMKNGRYRVVQWATGNIGLRSLRAVIEHPQMDLVGVYVYSETKEGRDAGELCGLEPVGVNATSDVEQIIALRPDCVLYMGDRADIDVLCRLLESGANVVSTRSEFHQPESMDPTLRERIEAACRQGGASIHSTGSSPGFITEALPFALLSIQRRLDCLTIDEFADMSSRNSPELIFNLMGFGRDPATFDPTGIAYHMKSSFGPSLSLVAETVSLPIDDLVATSEIAVALRRVQVAAGELKEGTMAAQRSEVAAVRNGRPVIRFRSNWYLTTDTDPAWDLRETGWHLLLEGDTPLDIDIRFPVPPEQWAATSPGLTAHRPVNAIPYVCAAEPGIRTTADLPQIIPCLR